jgi:hypothetical protein
MVADAIHYQLALRYHLTTPVAGFAVGNSAEDLRAVVAGKHTARELFPDEKAQRFFGRQAVLPLTRSNA